MDINQAARATPIDSATPKTKARTAAFVEAQATSSRAPAANFQRCFCRSPVVGNHVHSEGPGLRAALVRVASLQRRGLRRGGRSRRVYARLSLSAFSGGGVEIHLWVPVP